MHILKNKRIINPVRFWIIIGIAVLCLVLSIALLHADREYHTMTVYVESGETLWRMSQKYNNTDMEIREYIDLVCRINKIDPLIHPGQEILMPVM